MRTCAIAVALVLFVGAPGFAQSDPPLEAPGIAPSELNERRESGTAPAVIDVRTPEEIQNDGVAPRPFGRKPYLVRLRTDVQEYTRNHNVLYPRLWNENKAIIGALVQMVADPNNHPILIQGQIGVDRTGIWVAALLELGGIPRPQIMADFMIYERRTPPRGP